MDKIITTGLIPTDCNRETTIDKNYITVLVYKF